MPKTLQQTRRPARLIFGWVLLAGLIVAGTPASAKVYASRKEAVAEAFPGSTRVEEKTFMLDSDQFEAIQQLAKTKLDSRILTLYTGYRGDEVIGYALIDIHTVRTLPEAFLVVISPAGEVSRLRLLAFYEPEEYAPNERWLAQFSDRSLQPDLRLNAQIHGIAGSTLTSRAVTDSVRRALATYRVLLEERIAARTAPTSEP